MEDSAGLSADADDAERLAEFTALWEACRSSVRAYLRSFLCDRSAVDDCIQEVALVVWKKGPHGKGERAFLGYSLACARLIGLAASRKQGRSPVQFLPPDLALSLADEVMLQEQAEPSPADRTLALRSCLSRLDERQRHLLDLRYAREGHVRLKDEAQREGKSVDALYKKLERLRAILRDCVASQMERNHRNT